MQMENRAKNRIFLVWLLVLPLAFSLAQAEELLLVNVEIPEGYQHISEGDSILVDTQINLVGYQQNNTITDVVIEYVIKDKEGNIITRLSETKGGFIRIQTVKELLLPSNLPLGIYSVIVRANYKDVSRESSVSFEITKTYLDSRDSSQTTTKNLLITLVIGMVVLFLFSAYQFWKLGRIHRGGG